ncbi:MULTISPECIES: glycosyltransferase family 2 protein [Olivibacter]|jgi:glycosyltransferase involved in cell wall biosynthesis|uniref:Glycosyltransferase family 2 protein n=1 Tax=Olivibacter oleidegradans TaxID=760123 RepID=A0ABV6HRQ7_9SPHI|nr:MULTISPECIES: glycosyltransferase family 2 protein [Olivibacter]MDM8176212.1 glycosyltransferase family 2 protein [Olivibacter sp. 47]
MLKDVRVALVISTYNWPEALHQVLVSVRNQYILPDEVLIADDGSDSRTKNLISSFKQEFPVPIRHFWHPDEGFRKAIIMNAAIASSSSDYIVQIDGDIIVHPNFIKDHIEEAEKGCYIKGSRVLLSSLKTSRILASKEKRVTIKPYSCGITNRLNACRLPSLSKLFIKKHKRSHDLRGCNCAYWKKDFVAINGYNNELQGWGHEDIELAARFINLGLLQKTVKLKAICYHLDHPYNPRLSEQANYLKYKEVVKEGNIRCKDGLEGAVLNLEV